MSLCLTRDEMQELSGCKQRGRVILWFQNSGYRFEIGADGWPRVLRAAVDAKLMPSTGRRILKKSEPDFSAYATSKKAA